MQHTKLPCNENKGQDGYPSCPKCLSRVQLDILLFFPSGALGAASKSPADFKHRTVNHMDEYFLFASRAVALSQLLPSCLDLFVCPFHYFCPS